MDANEEYVRSRWESVTDSVYDPYGGYSLPQTQITFGLQKVTRLKSREAWSAAAKLTRQHEEEIRQLREEIAVISTGVETCSCEDDEKKYGAPLRRILARLESTLAELIVGWKEQ